MVSLCCFMQVTTDGYIIMGQDTPPTAATPTIPGNINILAPYAADIDTSLGGNVNFTDFISSDAEIDAVNIFIRAQTRNTFSGKRILVTQWDHVPQHGGDPVSC